MYMSWALQTSQPLCVTVVLYWRARILPVSDGHAHGGVPDGVEYTEMATGGKEVLDDLLRHLRTEEPLAKVSRL